MIVLFKIGELASQSNVAVATIRYYESLQLIKPVKKTSSGYRYYDQTAIKRVKFIKQASTGTSVFSGGYSPSIKHATAGTAYLFTGQRLT